MDQIAAMRSFRKVLELGSFSAAARQLGLSKAAVSKQVSELESHLGATLIHRTTRRLHPTDAGQAYFDSSVALLDELETADAAVRHLQSEPAGTLRVSVPSAFGQLCISSLLAEIGRRHPKLTVAVEATDRLVDLVEEGFDAAIRIRAQLPDSTLIAKRIRQIPFLVVASPAYLKANGTPQKPEDLARHNCFIYTLSNRPFDWPFKGRRSVKVKGSLHSNHGHLLLEPLRAGLGIAMLPEFLLSADLEAGRVVPILSKFIGDPLSLYVVYPPSRHSSPKIRALVDLVAEWFGPDQSWTEAMGTTAAKRRGSERERARVAHG
ncbi:MAG TPA: LysR family transcriptional regulator [Candidatus Binatia bacterium]|nr:LysR family transcriptional regulator [Candidatus Binatia bacterium]